MGLCDGEPGCRQPRLGHVRGTRVDQRTARRHDGDNGLSRCVHVHRVCNTTISTALHMLTCLLWPCFRGVAMVWCGVATTACGIAGHLSFGSSLWRHLDEIGLSRTCGYFVGIDINHR